MLSGVPPLWHNEVTPAPLATAGGLADPPPAKGIDVADRICSVDDCGKTAHARGLCPMHYQRWRLHGSIKTPPPARYAPFQHGTSQGYRYHRCRCQACKQWRGTYYAAYIARRRATQTFKHGREGYNCGCRCEICDAVTRAGARAAYLRNPERAKEGASRNGEIRRARQRNLAAYKVTARDWRRLCARYHNRCAYCGGSGPLQRDHIVPISRGGQHSIGNLLPACKRCNLSKMTKLLVEWRTQRRTSMATVVSSGGGDLGAIASTPSPHSATFGSGTFASPDQDEQLAPADEGAKGVINPNPSGSE